MLKLIESIGRWGISHNMNGIIIAILITIIVSVMIYDYKSTSKVRK